MGYINRDFLVKGWNSQFNTDYLGMKELLKVEYEKQKSTFKIAKMLVISPSTVQNWMNEYGMKPSSDIDKSEILTAYNSSSSIHEFAQCLKIGSRRAKKLMNKYDLDEFVRTNPNSAIDRDEIVSGYNEKYDTSYISMKELLQALYVKHKAFQRVEPILGVCHNTLRKWAIGYDIPIGPKGGVRTSACIAALKSMPAIKINRMNLRSLSKEIGFSYEHTRKMLKKLS